MGCAVSEIAKVEELRLELEELRVLVNTLLTIIMEEADGIHSGTAPSVPGHPKRGYSM
ncbi:MAG: hypothetical protein QGG76_03945 [Candidatus Thalassarchaeaceae archaeon]|jgi:hypothetical protein|nr:hypothetical protein [Candidatus Thalassarchaeaceae archaeon]|tara:strand:+ start:22432 stop:22605 length:174 start_codon:yes stop_codon:yes gene_type:complete